MLCPLTENMHHGASEVSGEQQAGEWREVVGLRQRAVARVNDFFFYSDTSRSLRTILRRLAKLLKALLADASRQSADTPGRSPQP